MYNLYQSQLWIDIQTKVYNKPHFFVHIFGKKYFGLTKSKKVGPFVFKWHQVLGVEIDKDESEIKKEILAVRKGFGNDWKTIAFQWGIHNEIISFENIACKSKEFVKDMRQMRLDVRSTLTSTYNLKLAARENMPQCDIVYNLNKSDADLLAAMNSGAKERIKKGIKNEVSFERLPEERYEEFYAKRKELAGDKGFNIIPYPQFLRLIDYIRIKKSGELFLSHYEGKVLAGSICLFDDHRVIFYQGFASRDKKLRNIGGHAYLKFKIMGRARDHGFLLADMMGGTPTGFPEHPLAGVTKFKESMGGSKTEQYGSYDIILNKLLYKIFEIRNKLRH